MSRGDEPAYPITDTATGLDGGQYEYTEQGLTIRERFAMAAMQGMLAHGAPSRHADDLAFDAVQYAEALLAELGKRR
jgi:hypothetical protein